MRHEGISRLVEESKGYIAKGDPVQASEKLYKVVEECIKLLAEKYGLPEYEKSEEDGRWKTYLLSQAAGKLSRNLKERGVKDTWTRAFDIHVWGFHEGKFSVEEIEQSIPDVEWLVDYVKGQV